MGSKGCEATVKLCSLLRRGLLAVHKGEAGNLGKTFQISFLPMPTPTPVVVAHVAILGLGPGVCDPG